ncbi:MAG: nucleotidyltransferase domain-containing protein [Armatimonadetes bacterium]|nr:nucleotidyltransferase domain-containing protein [Armatimonadota bacterium]
MTLPELRERRAEIEAVAAAHGASNIRVFGSVARGDADERSDVDLLVDVAPGVGWTFFGLYEALGDLLGCKVDVVADGNVVASAARFMARAHAEAVPL